MAEQRESTITTAVFGILTYDRILFDVMLFIVTLQVLVVGTLAGVFPSGSGLARVPIILFGLLGIAVGNLLPRTGPNLAIGIRTRRTLCNRQAWQIVPIRTLQASVHLLQRVR